MAQFHSSVNTDSDDFRKHRADMLASIATMRGLLDRAATLSDRSLPRFEKRGQLLPRERLNRLLDPGMPFLELMNMAGFSVDTGDREKSIPGCSRVPLEP